MIALIQRVVSGKVVVKQNVLGEINQGIVALIGVEKADTEKNAQRLIDRILSYRIFADENDRMNISLQTIQGGLLLVPQFTLVADTKKGTKPSFSAGATPAHGKAMFSEVMRYSREVYFSVETGEFGADMQVHLVNDGPVTFWLQA